MYLVHCGALEIILSFFSGSFAPKIAGKITPSELKFTFQMKDKFDGVNPKHRVKRESQGYNSGETYIGTCSHYWFVSSKQFSFLSPHFNFMFV